MTMDVAVARTFLEIVRTGSFVGAAANLNLTQTAVSARIRGLETQLASRSRNRRDPWRRAQSLESLAAPLAGLDAARMSRHCRALEHRHA